MRLVGTILAEQAQWVEPLSRVYALQVNPGPCDDVRHVRVVPITDVKEFRVCLGQRDFLKSEKSCVENYVICLWCLDQLQMPERNYQV